MRRNYNLWVFAASVMVFVLISCLALYLLGPVEEGGTYIITDETPFTGSWRIPWN